MSEFPPAFVERQQALLGPEWPAFAEALAAAAPASLRHNSRKPAALPPGTEPVPWASAGHYLPERPAFSQDPAWHAGAYYVQEASSMLAGELVRHWAEEAASAQPLLALDLCAAPGGKSTHLLDALPPGSILVANEVIRSRLAPLTDNLARWGRAEVLVTNNDPADFNPLQGHFDLVLVDAPCSGEGLWRRQPQAMAEWSPAAVAHCARRQQRILAAAAPLVRPGGLLLYSTCTYAPEENDDQLRALLPPAGTGWAPYHPPLPGTGDWTTIALDGQPIGWRGLPHRISGEGFGLMALQRAGSFGARQRPGPSKRFRKQLGAVPAGWLSDAAEWFTHPAPGSGHWALPPPVAGVLEETGPVLRIHQAGVPLGEPSGKAPRPAHALALSTHLAPDIPHLNLATEQARAYLRGEALAQEAPNGLVLLRWQGLGLGWGKAAAGRINNHYPKASRIRKG